MEKIVFIKKLSRHINNCEQPLYQVSVSTLMHGTKFTRVGPTCAGFLFPPHFFFLFSFSSLLTDATSSMGPFLSLCNHRHHLHTIRC